MTRMLLRFSRPERASPGSCVSDATNLAIGFFMFRSCCELPSPGSRMCVGSADSAVPGARWRCAGVERVRRRGVRLHAPDAAARCARAAARRCACRRPAVLLAAAAVKQSVIYSSTTGVVVLPPPQASTATSSFCSRAPCPSSASRTVRALPASASLSPAMNAVRYDASKTCGAFCCYRRHITPARAGTRIARPQASRSMWSSSSRGTASRPWRRTSSTAAPARKGGGDEAAGRSCTYCALLSAARGPKAAGRNSSSSKSVSGARGTHRCSLGW